MLCSSEIPSSGLLLLFCADCGAYHNACTSDCSLSLSRLNSCPVPFPALISALIPSQVVVHNLPWATTWQQLKDLFKEWKVERADVVYDTWGKSRCGEGF